MAEHDRLKSCPKCGADAKLLTVWKENFGMNYEYRTHSVTCSNDGCCMTTDDYSTYSYPDAERLAVYQWNHQPWKL